MGDCAPGSSCRRRYPNQVYSVRIEVTTVKLYHKDKLIGTISNVAPEDTFEMSGDIELTPEADLYRPVFVYLTNGDALTKVRP